jgi:hypothetical protein
MTTEDWPWHAANFTVTFDDYTEELRKKMEKAFVEGLGGAGG